MDFRILRSLSRIPFVQFVQWLMDQNLMPRNLIMAATRMGAPPDAGQVFETGVDLVGL